MLWAMLAHSETVMCKQDNHRHVRLFTCHGGHHLTYCGIIFLSVHEREGEGEGGFEDHACCILT